MPVAVITDSAAALEPRVAADLGISVVPLRIRLGGQEYHDGQLDHETVLRRLDTGFSTSAPSPGDFAVALEQHGDDEAVVITVAGTVSATLTAARAARDALPPQQRGRVQVVDSQTAAGAQALVVIGAARVAQRGGPLDEVAAAGTAIAAKVRLVAMVGSLEHLIRSGRVPGVLGGVGRTLGVKPLFELRRGRIIRLLPARDRERGEGRILERWRRSRPDPPAPLHCAALGATPGDEAAGLLQRVTAETAPETALMSRFGPAMVGHTGPDVTGLAWWWGESP